MGSVIGDLLPLGVGVAISPIPIIAAILMLMSARAKSTSIGFAIGWILGIVVAAVIFVFVGGGTQSDGQPSTATAAIKIFLGVVLLILAARQWRGRDASGEAPKWMQAIDDLTLPKGLGLGFALAAVNPKNLLMCIAAGIAIGSAGLAAGQATVAVVVFVVIAASTVVIPVVGYLLAADKLRGPLDELKQWLQANNAAVMSVLLLVIGVVLIGKGIGGLN
ncbi:GAP family protein [Rhodococcus sp. D2-41]|uniref:GAP family protein n=1 Tax=Speluncibacter jeojiensis TaxID=2710754 RepID=A0A9X4RIS2_9ACTN|nr:GAP family protein [Rhodococcus sp. D2-41]MDG3009472.1 GAP family protein [Rhodococcus sp. D2-41]MDG3016401.1 GAP family protein [Corynebacteriales bacterium D3-21]